MGAWDGAAGLTRDVFLSLGLEDSQAHLGGTSERKCRRAMGRRSGLEDAVASPQRRKMSPESVEAGGEGGKSWENLGLEKWGGVGWAIGQAKGRVGASQGRDLL